MASSSTPFHECRTYYLKSGLTLGYLKQLHLRYDEISYLVGFSYTANFNRAFKKWTGQTPSVYRESLTKSVDK
ncbi:helix-turn-helix transcriptional regulator [Alteromonas sp. BZK5]|nr:helix-turn-helix transcriptional regulator [Alteromonas sp. BZK5]